MKKFTSLLLAGVLLLQSCASIISKRYYPIIINSSPPEAKIIVTDKKGIKVYAGNTPAFFNLKSGGSFSKARYQVKLIKEGYDTKIIPITSKIDGWYSGNFLFGAVPAAFFLALGGVSNFFIIIGVGILLNPFIYSGFIIDSMTGSKYKLDKESLDVILIKSTSNVQKEELKD